MIRLTRQDVLAHQHSVLWPEAYQIEQDLLLSLAMRAIFSDEFLRTRGYAWRHSVAQGAPRPCRALL